MASNGEAELLEAVRELLISDTLLSGAGIFNRTAPREDALPYVLLSLKPMPTTQTLSGTKAWWRRLQIKVCSAPDEGLEALEIAKPLLDAAYTLFTETDGDGSPKDKLNALLASLGFKSMVPIEAPELEPYDDNVGDLVRSHYGLNFDLRMSRL